MDYNIRLATQADAPEVVRVVKAVYDEYGFSWDAEEYHADLYDLGASYIESGHPFWIAESPDGQTLGTCAVDLFHPLPGRPGELVQIEGRTRVGCADCSMERLYVDPLARRLGIGRALAREAVKDACARGRRYMELWSDKRFVKAHSLYISMGARIVGDRICHDPDQSPEWGLLLPLE